LNLPAIRGVKSPEFAVSAADRGAGEGVEIRWMQPSRRASSFTNMRACRTAPPSSIGATGPAGPAGPKGDPGELSLANQTCPTGAFVTGFDSVGHIVCSNVTPPPTCSPTTLTTTMTSFTNGDLIPVARDDAKLALEQDPELVSERGRALRILLYLFERDAVVRTLRSG